MTITPEIKKMLELVPEGRFKDTIPVDIYYFNRSNPNHRISVDDLDMVILVAYFFKSFTYYTHIRSKARKVELSRFTNPVKRLISEEISDNIVLCALTVDFTVKHESSEERYSPIKTTNKGRYGEDEELSIYSYLSKKVLDTLYYANVLKKWEPGMNVYEYIRFKASIHERDQLFTSRAGEAMAYAIEHGYRHSIIVE